MVGPRLALGRSLTEQLDTKLYDDEIRSGAIGQDQGRAGELARHKIVGQQRELVLDCRYDDRACRGTRQETKDEVFRGNGEKRVRG
jgi:hypothetical protein